MVGILLLAHGSREKDSEDTMREITNMVKAELKIDLIEEAYLQFREVNLEKGLLSLIEKGATDIKIMPYFLFEGVHIREDIPAEIAEFLKSHSGVKITLGKTLGADNRLAQVVADRIREQI